MSWLWPRIRQTMKYHLPWYTSLVPAVGLSSRMIQVLDEYTWKYNHTEYIEVFYTTAAMHNKFNILNLPEFSFHWTPDIYQCADVQRNVYQWYHPIKNMAHFLHQCPLNISTSTSNSSSFISSSLST